jgi:calcium/proton exchanger cax
VLVAVLPSSFRRSRLPRRPERHSLALLTIPVAIVPARLYSRTTIRNLRRHAAAHTEERGEAAWSLPRSLVALGLATAVTALISEILVHSLDGFAEHAGLSEFFIAIVIVAIVGNAAEHGGAVVIARRGGMVLASEIAILVERAGRRVPHSGGCAAVVRRDTGPAAFLQADRADRHGRSGPTRRLRSP